MVDREVLRDMMGFETVVVEDLLGDIEKLKREKKQLEIRVDAFVYEYQRILEECRQLRSSEEDLKKKIRIIEYDRDIEKREMRLELMEEIVELKARLYDMLQEEIRLSKPVLKLISGGR